MKTALEQLIVEISTALNQNGIRHALAGGFAASLYRANTRVTLDLDLAIDVGSHEVKRVSDILKDRDMTLSRATLGQLQGAPSFVSKRSPIAVLTGSGSAGKVDLLFSSMPWVTEAVDRAQSNLISVQGLNLPVLLPEDLIIAKLVSLQNDATRIKDVDDIQEIFSNVKDLDVQYIGARVRGHELKIPESLRTPFTTVGLSMLMRQRRRMRR